MHCRFGRQLAGVLIAVYAHRVEADWPLGVGGVEQYQVVMAMLGNPGEEIVNVIFRYLDRRS